MDQAQLDPARICRFGRTDALYWCVVMEAAGKTGTGTATSSARGDVYSDVFCTTFGFDVVDSLFSPKSAVGIRRPGGPRIHDGCPCRIESNKIGSNKHVR